ncbi:alpha/beta fold hydrolase [Brevundimonas sp.]|uniref:alpha/beta hydrolase family protein n=1 Tax=Brevundimonas sp. TaxID=1871086 RepID=UPI003D1059DF
MSNAHLRTRVCLAALIALATAVPLVAQAQTPAPPQTQAEPPSTPRTYSAADFFKTTSFGLASGSGLAFSPDGASVLVSSDVSGVFNAYAIPVTGGAPVPLTASTTNATYAESYFPNDARILVAADRGGDERSHVYVRELDGTLRDLTPGDAVKANLIGWSGDRSEIWVASNARDTETFDIVAIDPTTYESRLLFQNTGMTLAAISADGRWVVLEERLGSADGNIHLVDLQAGGEPRLITPHEGSARYRVFDFTPDSQALMFGSDAVGEFGRGYRYDLATGSTTEDLKGDWDLTALSYSPTGRYRISAFNADARTELTVLDTTTGRAVALAGVPEGDIGTVRFSDDERRMAFTVASDTSPNDIFVADLTTGHALRLTTALNPAMREDDLVEATVVRYRGEGDVMIPAILYRPHGASAANPVPAIVLVHGGPGGQSRRGYSAMVQHLVNHGYAVLAANNRGSSGYGKTFLHMDDRRHGEADLRDIVAGGDWLRAQDWIADDQVAVMGGSYGGYLAVAALAFHPEAFEAGIDIFGVTNWVRTLTSIPAWWGAQRATLYDEMGDPATDAERHRRISPLFHAENIVKPLLVVQGANDPRVLQIESDEMVAAVRANDVPVEYIVFPDEGHGFRKRDNRVAAQEAYLRFLDTHVRR